MAGEGAPYILPVGDRAVAEEVDRGVHQQGVRELQGEPEAGQGFRSLRSP